MRWFVLFVSALTAACLGATCATPAIAQTAQLGEAQDQIPPYATHVDRRHGNDHVYPDRGAVVRDVPQAAATVNYAGITFRFAGGVWYQRQGPAYIVVAPPIGVIVPQLPAFATTFDSGGKTYFYANDIFYRPRPDLGGYVVVNDPQDAAPRHSQISASGSATRMASASPEADRNPRESATVQPKDLAPPAENAAAAPANDAATPPNPTGVAISPRNGQTADQQALDRYECYRVAVGKTGVDPLASNSGTSQAEIARRNSEYAQVQAACLEARGYTVP